MNLFETEASIQALLDAEVGEIAARRGEAGNMHECYARMADARDRAVASTDTQKKTVESIWSSCKDGNAEEYDAYTKHLRDTALMGALAWLTLAAEADRALGRE